MRTFIVFVIILIAIACGLYVIVSSVSKPTFVREQDTGITFENTIEETDSVNILAYEYLYNGGGVAVADFNSDGKEDVYFTGNMVDNVLYLNEGDFHFRDVTAMSNSACGGSWCSGVSIIDINNDGRMDMYITVTGLDRSEDRTNILLVNQGNNMEGIPVFADRAVQYRLGLKGHSVHAVFLDYDRDGYMDVYVIQDCPTGLTSRLQPEYAKEDTNNLNRLLRNVGGKYFEDVTRESGMVDDGYSLGVAVVDANDDGWQDIFVSNDFVSSSTLFINQRNGTFKEMFSSYATHQSFSSMGVDFADINNDGRYDFLTLDMLPRTLSRTKQMFSKSNYPFLDIMTTYGEKPQYMRNCLYVQNAMGTYSEIGQLAGVHNTDWSWSALFADFDHDGLKDLYVTNGFPRDLTDLDFIKFKSSYNSILSSTSDMLSNIPVVKLPNVLFKNRGNYHFEDVTREWGMNTSSFSNGLATADLDGDGDLDILVNNINDEAFVYRNTTDKNYLQIHLKGPASNSLALYAKVVVYAQGLTQYGTVNPYRGYLSSNTLVQHFGMGSHTKADSIKIFWDKTHITTLKNVRTNQKVEVEYKSAFIEAQGLERTVAKPFLEEVAAAYKLDVMHHEDESKDFYTFDLQQKVYTNEGPPLAVGDINGDSLQDIIMGQGVGEKSTILLQQPEGMFVKFDLKQDEADREVTALSLFDVEGDGDLDLYVGYGHCSFKDRWLLKDKILLNNGKGMFYEKQGVLPDIREATSKVLPFDADQDGDLDIVVFSRVRIYDYPLSPQSFMLVNNGGTFEDKTNSMLPDSGYFGMVTDAQLLDINNDGIDEILFCGEWASLKLLQKKEGRFEDITSGYFGEQLTGWWNVVLPFDVDQDGDLDIIAGNYGDNHPYHISKAHPLKLVYGKLANQHEVHSVVFDYTEGGYYPIHLRADIMRNFPWKKKKFLSYKTYAHASLEDLLSEQERAECRTLLLNTSTSMVFENKNGQFMAHPLPEECQFSPVFGIALGDLDGDGNFEILLVGNDPAAESFVGPKNAMMGNVVRLSKQFNFTVLPVSKTGFYVDGFAKRIYKELRAGSDLLYLVPINGGKLKAFRKVRKYK